MLVCSADGMRGELCIKGASVMKEYKNKPEATAEAIDSEGFFHSGRWARTTNGEYVMGTNSSHSGRGHNNVTLTMTMTLYYIVLYVLTNINVSNPVPPSVPGFPSRFPVHNCALEVSWQCRGMP